MEDKVQNEKNDRDNEGVGSLELLIPLLENYLAHDSPNERRQLVPALKEHFHRLLAKASTLIENPPWYQLKYKLWIEDDESKVFVTDGELEECWGFLPMKMELLVLAKYWIRTSLEISFSNFCYSQYCGADRRIEHLAWRSLNRIGLILGSKALEAAEVEVEKEFASGIDPWLWKMFLHGGAPDLDEQGKLIPPKQATPGT